MVRGGPAGPVAGRGGRDDCPLQHVVLQGAGRDQSAVSLSFFSGRTLTLTVAGLAANTCSRPVNGFLPL
ncbi:hypothetical protein LF63_0106505 [Oleiagrimonas soli]|uniref:Uncharacterized protein n=1 Tax=Oleiagrimonas soli TaxID=1543381 RepID=A0A099CVT6_9GAMM|nr:hypothetical protein LF63_0106505 [Oleiagrimonas soli]